ncbi:hypothetical protein BDZ89DRAFT_1023937 [Hymenopellis radicata]|nr:hypothetical protein BDZ89DRAFT_1023937 [Hymenopellis radicata]
MDASALNVNVSVDDFDSILSYSPDQAPWVTPDPFSADVNLETTPWWLGTYHRTEQIDASISLNFTGPAIYVYGMAGPEYGSFEVGIDDNKTTLSAYAAENGTAPHLLYSTDKLAYTNHTLTLKNLGKLDGDKGGNAFLFDFLYMTVQMAPAGATISNKTLEETDPSITYSGEWDNNSSGNFSGGGTTYTNGDLASFTLDFQASAIYLFGDKKNDHREYNVYLDNGTAQTFNATSGCGGAFGQTCEEQQPTIKYFASNLDASVHTLKVENLAGVNHSFFDFDNIVLTVPSEYAPRNLSVTSSSSGNGSSSTSGSSGSSDAASSLLAFNPLFLLAFTALFVLKPRFH